MHREQKKESVVEENPLEQKKESAEEEKKLLAGKGSAEEETMLRRQMLTEESKKLQLLVERRLGE